MAPARPGPSPPAEERGTDRAKFRLLQRSVHVEYVRAYVGILRGRRELPGLSLVAVPGGSTTPRAQRQ